MTDDGPETSLSAAKEMLRRASKARRQGDLAAAWQHVLEAQAYDLNGRIAEVGVMRADIQSAQGQDDEAFATLHAVAQAHPGNLKSFYRLALLHRRRGEVEETWQNVEAALACDPERRNGAVHSLWADLLVDAGRDDEAIQALQAAVETNPDALWAYRRLAQITERNGDHAAAAGYVQAAINTSDGNTDLEIDLARLLTLCGDFAGTVRVLQGVRDRDGPNTRVSLRLVHAYREMGQRAQERACLDDLIATDVSAPDLLRLIFGTYSAHANPQTAQDVLDRLQGRVAPELFEELKMRALTAAQDHEAALQYLLVPPKAGRSETKAHWLATALFGVHRYRLGQRYVRACLWRWPANRQLLSLYVSVSLKLGRYDDVAVALKRAEPHQPERSLVPLWFLLHGYQGELEPALKRYERMQELGLVRIMHQHRLITMIFSLPDLDEVDAIFDRVGRPNPANAEGRNQSTLPGQQMTEFDLERLAVAEQGGFDTVKDWAKARPGSTVAAVRMVNAWYADAPNATDPKAARIPKQIFQYWDQPQVPDSIADLVATWAEAPGFSYQRLDRAAGARFLTQDYGGDWVKAFRLARNAAQEADFLRLCLLAKRGGIYADADDICACDLTQLLGAGRGLVVYREPLGGILANNFIAAAPDHPAIVMAAKEARDALLQRSNETIWSSTGPGLMTRAVGQYLAQLPDRKKAALTLLDWSEIASNLFMHNRIAYKSSPKHWNWNSRSPEGVLEALQVALKAQDESGA